MLRIQLVVRFKMVGRSVEMQLVKRGSATGQVPSDGSVKRTWPAQVCSERTHLFLSLICFAKCHGVRGAEVQFRIEKDFPKMRAPLSRDCGKKGPFCIFSKNWTRDTRVSYLCEAKFAVDGMVCFQLVLRASESPCMQRPLGGISVA